MRRINVSRKWSLTQVIYLYDLGLRVDFSVECEELSLDPVVILVISLLSKMQPTGNDRYKLLICHMPALAVARDKLYILYNLRTIC